MRTRCVCTAAAASTPAMPTRSGPICSSVRNSSLWPSRTACSASARMRAIAARSVSGPPPAVEGAVDLGDLRRRNSALSRAQSAPVSTGEFEHQHAVAPILGIEDVGEIAEARLAATSHAVRASGSIGGLVTWLKFWRKNWLISRGLSEMTASGVSSPIEPIASLASSTIGDEDQLHILQRLAGGDLAAGQFGAVEARHASRRRRRADRRSCGNCRSSRHNRPRRRSGP